MLWQTLRTPLPDPFEMVATVSFSEDPFSSRPSRASESNTQVGYAKALGTAMPETLFKANASDTRSDGKTDGPTFTLSEVTERLPELEFMLPIGESNSLAELGIERELRRAGGYLWGYVDLVFRHRGRYYLLDWKSNTLGDYSPPALEASMRHDAYDLQGRLYAFALHRWLQGRLKDYRPESHFGGIFYLYLRGLQGNFPSASPFQGIAAWKPTLQDLEIHYPRHLSAYLGVQSQALTPTQGRSRV